MSELLTAAEMRALERAAIDSGAVTGLELMERAGRGVVEAIFAEWPDLAAAPHHAVVLCGPGNNGGDGFVIARLLKEWCFSVELFLYGAAARLPPDARANHDRWQALGSVRPLAEFVEHQHEPPKLLIDALFGTGLSRALEPLAISAIGKAEIMRSWRPRVRVVAVDLPSGLCSDSGRALFETDEWTSRFVGRRPGADLTVTFERPKLGHVLAEGLERCGRLRVVPLGIRHDVDGVLDNPSMPMAHFAEPATRLLGKSSGAHKYHHGHALVLSGGPGRGGAARMAARGALRIGAGLVTVGCPPAALQENAGALDAIMLRPVRDAGHLTEILGDERLNAICIGPGFGLGERTRAFVAAALAAERATVLDGDALTAFAEDPAALFALTHKGVVLTPHAGEFARLFPDLAARLADAPATGPAFSKLDATREAAARAGCVVLHKGPDTVIAGPDGRAAIAAAVYDRAAPWLATAGSGDVLAGFVTGLLARGFGPDMAAGTAAWLHVECARAFGPGLIAEDLPEALPGVFRGLGL